MLRDGLAFTEQTLLIFPRTVRDLGTRKGRASTKLHNVQRDLRDAITSGRARIEALSLEGWDDEGDDA